MRRIHSNRREKWIQFLLAILFDEILGGGIQFVKTEHPDAMLRKARTQLSVPAIVLLIDEVVRLLIDAVPLLSQGQTIGRAFIEPVFNLLHQSGNPYLEKLVEIAG